MIMDPARTLAEDVEWIGRNGIKQEELWRSLPLLPLILIFGFCSVEGYRDFLLCIAFLLAIIMESLHVIVRWDTGNGTSYRSNDHRYPASRAEVAKTDRLIIAKGSRK
jgi:hypothetical protein